MHEVNINYLAVLVSSILAFGIGSLWYGPLFSKLWMKESGFTEEFLKKDFNPAKTFGLAFVGHFFIGLVVAYFISLTNAQTISDGIRVSSTAWFGFMFSTLFINQLFQRKSFTLLSIDAGYHFVNMIIFGIILILWR